MAVLEVERWEGRVSGNSGMRVDFLRDWKSAAARWKISEQCTNFQHSHWLRAWYDAFDTVSPIIAVVSDAATGCDLALVPLIRRTLRGVRTVEFADLGLTDYNAPLLTADAPADKAGAQALCRALMNALRELPGGVDLVRMQKMPATVGGKPNPLVSMGRVGSCSLNGNLVTTSDDLDAYHTSIKRMQLPRCWRVFSRHPGARLKIATDVEEAIKFLDAMDVQQNERMKQLGVKFVLDDDRHARFYRDIVRRGVADKYAVVSALICDDGIVATTLGVRVGTNYSLLRTSNAGRPWSNCSPGLLTFERTMAALHEDGVRTFDLSIGNYPYKRRFGAVQIRLTDVSIALTWRGTPYAWRDYAAQALRRHPRLAAAVNRLLRGRYPGEEE
jgi:CelD/BcsL family acetyltransferase involved in cellulose biosynthesis